MIVDSDYEAEVMAELYAIPYKIRPRLKQDQHPSSDVSRFQDSAGADLAEAVEEEANGRNTYVDRTAVQVPVKATFVHFPAPVMSPRETQSCP